MINVKFPVKMKRFQQKLIKFAQILGILNNSFKRTWVQKSSMINVYNALDLTIRLHGNDIWTAKEKDKND
jgi:hypothetical protein